MSVAIDDHDSPLLLVTLGSKLVNGNSRFATQDQIGQDFGRGRRLHHPGNGVSGSPEIPSIGSRVGPEGRKSVSAVRADSTPDGEYRLGSQGRHDIADNLAQIAQALCRKLFSKAEIVVGGTHDYSSVRSGGKIAGAVPP